MANFSKTQISPLSDDAFLDSIGAKRNGYEFTIRELRAAFDRIAPKPNWKAAVHAEFYTTDVDVARDLNLYHEAVVFMTGSEPEISFVERDCTVLSFLVEAAGYYQAVGA